MQRRPVKSHGRVHQRAEQEVELLRRELPAPRSARQRPRRLMIPSSGCCIATWRRSGAGRARLALNSFLFKKVVVKVAYRTYGQEHLRLGLPQSKELEGGRLCQSAPF